jgi:hypothetical protein
MSAINGTLYAIFSTAGIISTAVASTDRVFSCKNTTFKCDVDLPDVSTKESGGWAEHLAGIKSASVDFGGVWDESGTATALTAAEILALIIAGNAKRKFAFVPAALGTTIPGWKFMGSFKGMQLGADMEAGCTFSGSAVASGAVSLFDA